MLAHELAEAQELVDSGACEVPRGFDSYGVPEEREWASGGARSRDFMPLRPEELPSAAIPSKSLCQWVWDGLDPIVSPMSYRHLPRPVTGSIARAQAMRFAMAAAVAPKVTNPVTGGPAVVAMSNGGVLPVHVDITNPCSNGWTPERTTGCTVTNPVYSAGSDDSFQSAEEFARGEQDTVETRAGVHEPGALCVSADVCSSLRTADCAQHDDCDVVFVEDDIEV